MKENNYLPRLPKRYLPTFIQLLGILLISTACAASPITSSNIPDSLELLELDVYPIQQNLIQTEIAPPSSPALPTTQILDIADPIDTLESEIETGNIKKAQTFIENTSLLTIPTNTFFPPPIIKIYTPGDMSRVVSPFRIVGEFPNASGTQILIELFGEDSRLLNRQLIDYFGPTSLKSSTISTEVKFETQLVAEAGKLRITLFDENSVLQSINSINLILLREGFTENTGYGDMQSNLIILHPSENSILQGTSVFVSGYVRVGNLEPLSVKIIDDKGLILGNAEALVLETTNSDYSLFLASVPLSIKSSISARLVVEALGTKINGTNFLNIVKINLEP